MGQDAVSVLNLIRADHRNDVRTYCSRMFTLWRQRTPKANWKQLIEALKEVNLNHLASELEGLLMPSVEHSEVSQSEMTSHQECSKPQRPFLIGINQE